MSTEPTEAERKTLDDIRRELDAQYGYIDISEPALDTGDAAPDRARDVERAVPPIAERSSEREDAEEERFDAPLTDFRQIADRHQVAMGRRPPSGDGRPRRSGYLIAGVVGCVAGQALLFAFLTVTWYGSQPDLSRTSAVVSPGSQFTTAAPIHGPEPEASAAVASPPSPTLASPAVPQERTPPPTNELPPRVAREPRASSAPQPAVVSAATVPESVTPRMTRESRPAAARQPGLAGPTNLADSQARLRSALNEWLRTSARGDAPVQATEPVIVLSPDGRTAKIFVSLTSPIGLIPREQRWELSARGWNLVDDRQAGLPMPGTAPSSRDR